MRFYVFLPKNAEHALFRQRTKRVFVITQRDIVMDLIQSFKYRYRFVQPAQKTYRRYRNTTDNGSSVSNM